jgi:hypothetical protein
VAIFRQGYSACVHLQFWANQVECRDGSGDSSLPNGQSDGPFKTQKINRACFDLSDLQVVSRTNEFDFLLLSITKYK